MVSAIIAVKDLKGAAAALRSSIGKVSNSISPKAADS